MEFLRPVPGPHDNALQVHVGSTRIHFYRKKLTVHIFSFLFGFEWSSWANGTGSLFLGAVAQRRPLFVLSKQCREDWAPCRQLKQHEL